MSSNVGRTRLGGGGPLSVALDEERATPLVDVAEDGREGGLGVDVDEDDCGPTVEDEAFAASCFCCLPVLIEGAGDLTLATVDVGVCGVEGSSSMSMTSMPSTTSAAGFANVGGETALDAMKLSQDAYEVGAAAEGGASTRSFGPTSDEGTSVEG